MVKNIGLEDLHWNMTTGESIITSMVFISQTVTMTHTRRPVYNSAFNTVFLNLVS